MSLIWATRGRTWGFRFLRNDASGDPLPVYDAAFSGVENTSEACRRVAETVALPEMVALRFPDPLGRQDRAGRVIPHDFVVFGPLADGIDSVEDARQRIWPLVADAFERVWKLSKPPSADG
ncbi:hypothetical protein [Geodermatophilus sp. CPCC 205761]|uniref:hypothetical protein n=1 Tax=Geodermatophilus sp. CPCC 205761 TaxID=2936597 RepID=UPI003EED6BFD